MPYATAHLQFHVCFFLRAKAMKLAALCSITYMYICIRVCIYIYYIVLSLCNKVALPSVLLPLGEVGGQLEGGQRWYLWYRLWYMVSNYYDDVALEMFTLFSMGHTKWSDEEVQGLDATRRANFVADCASFCLYQYELYKHTHTHIYECVPVCV